MRKRRKNHQNNRLEPDASQLDSSFLPEIEGPGEEYDDIVELAGSGTGDLVDELSGELVNGATADLVDAPDMLNAAADPDTALAGMEGMDPSDLETMDELLAELLAQDSDASVSEAQGTEAQGIEAESSEILAAPVLAAPILASILGTPEDGLDSLDSIDVPEPEEPGFVLDAAPSFEVPVAESIPAEAAALFAPLADEPKPEPDVLLAPEPESDAFEIDGLTAPETFRQEGLNALLDEMLDETGIPEPPAPVEAAPEAPPPLPLGPQPPLESVLGSIDRALESAPPVAGPAEPAYAPSHHQKQFSQLDDYVVFTLAGTDYAVPVRDVAEIGRVPGITRVPNVPDFVRGITNLRGEVVPVLNLPSLLGLQEAVLSARGRVLFLQARAHASSTGLLVDEVKGIQRIQSQQLEQVTGLMDDKITSVLRGVHGRGDRLLNVLDLEQLFQLPEFRGLESL